MPELKAELPACQHLPTPPAGGVSPGRITRPRLRGLPLQGEEWWGVLEVMASHPNGGVGRTAPTAASCPPTQAQPDKDGMIPLKEHHVIPGFLQGLELQCWQSFASSEPSSSDLKCCCPQNTGFTRFYLLDLSSWVWIFSSSSAQQLLPQDLSDPQVLSCPPAPA